MAFWINVGFWLLIGLYLLSLIGIPSALKNGTMHLSSSVCSFTIVVNIISIGVAFGLFTRLEQPYTTLSILAFAWLLIDAIYGVIESIVKFDRVIVFTKLRALRVLFFASLAVTSLIILYVS